MGMIVREEEFQDYFPVMATRLGEQDFMDELCKGFDMLADASTGTITLKSLKENARLLGLEDLSDEDLEGMLLQGDYDGDGVLSQHEFCILMIRISPALVAHAQDWLEEAIEGELEGLMEDEDHPLAAQEFFMDEHH